MSAAHTRVYDPFTHTVAEDPYPAYRELRDEHPVYHCEERDCWVLSRFEDVQAAARDWQRFSNEGGVELDQPAHYLGPGDFLEWDPPRHDRMRKVMHERFKPRQIAELEATVRARVEPMVEPMLARGHGDVGEELAFPLPMLTILDLMGLPEGEADRYRRLLLDVVARVPGSDETPAGAIAAERELEQATLNAVAERRRDPRDDLMTLIAEAEAGGEMEAEEIPGMCMPLLIAGWETSAGLLSNSFLHLAAHPDQRQLLLADPQLISRAVEEVLRYDAPVQHLMRLTTEPVELHGTTIPAGEQVLLLWAAANRDERRWERADEFDLMREPQRHVAFGEGIHHCLGAPLARLEARIALEIVLPRAPRFQVAGETRRLHAHVVRGLESLPMRF